MLHIDVMDGHFVPNISFGCCVLSSLSSKLDCFYDVHLMVEDPIKYINDFIEAGANSITFHIEGAKDIYKMIKIIKDNSCKVGIAINPNTEIDEIMPYISEVDFILVMTVHPGFSGQKTVSSAVENIKLIRDIIKGYNLNVDIHVDGGVNKDNYRLFIDSGADVVVSGSYLFSLEDPTDIILEMKNYKIK